MNALRSGMYRCLYELGRTLERAAKVVYYAAAGTMRLEDLEVAIRRDWREFGEEDPATDVAGGLMKWEQEFYPRFLKPDDRILIVGCGTGRDLIALLDLGYRADGLDVVPECTAIARLHLQRRGLTANIYTGPIETTSLPGRFDAFIFSWFCYGYIPQSRTRIRVLRKVKDHLNPGGRILISYVPATRGPRRFPVRVARIAARLCGSGWQLEHGDLVRLTSSMHGLHYEHLFRPQELEEEAQAADLSVVFHKGGSESRAVLTA